MNAKKRVQAEIVKKATVKEIKRLGEAGVKTLGIKKWFNVDCVFILSE